jgi:hypothetical protein
MDALLAVLAVLGDVAPAKSGFAIGVVIFLVVAGIAVVLIVLGIVFAVRRRRGRP